MTDPDRRRDYKLKALRFYEHERRLSYAQMGAFLLLTVAAAVGFWRIEQIEDADRRASLEADMVQRRAAFELCLTQQQGRVARREDVSAIADLGRDLVRGRPEMIARFDRYERERLADLPPVECPPVSLRSSR